MLKVEHPTDYLKGINSEIVDLLKEEQGIDQQTQKKGSILKRLKRSDSNSQGSQVREPISIFQEIKDQSKKQNLEDLLNKLRNYYPDDLKIGVALKTGDCFFDSVAQGLNELKDKGLVENSERFNVKSLRKDCANDASKYRDKIIKDAGNYFVPQKNVAFPRLGNIKDEKGKDVPDVQKTFDKYLDNIKKTAEEGGYPIWGRPEIEGQMISNKYDVVLYFYSTNEENGQKITVTKITPGNDELEVFIEGENLDQLHIDSNEKVVRIVSYKQHFVPLLGGLTADITEDVKVSKEEVYGVENKKSYSLIQDVKNFDLEGQDSQVQAQLNQDSCTANDVYGRLKEVKFDNDDSGNPGVWAGIDQINSYINNHAIKTSANGNELAYYIGPNNFGFGSIEGIKDIAKHICRRGDILNSFYGDKKSLDKPFIVISNTATVLAQSSTDVNQQGGTHWISWVLLPKKYVSLSGKEIDNNKYQVLFFDSLSKNSFPEELKKFLTEGGEFIEGETQIRLMPFCAREEIDFKNIKDLTGQQMNGNDCGWWATYYALMSVYTGGVEFLEELKGKKLSAKPLRRVMSLQESIEEQPKKQERPSEGNELEDIGKKSQELEQQLPDFSSDRLKRTNNDPKAGSSQQSSSDNSQSVQDNQAIDSAQHQQKNPNSPDFIDSDDEREKNTELFSAIKNGNLQKAQKLLKAGVKVSIIDKNNKDNTPLHYAIERDKKEIAEELLQEWKADINVQNNKGDTPLHIATSKGNKELVQLLVSNKAKTDIKNNEDRTPLDTAKHLKRQDIVEVLESHIQLNLKASVEEQSASQQQSQQKRTKTDSKEDKLEDSNPKKQKTSSTDVQPMGVDQDTSSRKRSHEDNPIQGKRISILYGKNTYDASGLKHTLHGNVYQLKLLMLFLKRGLNKRYSFLLATEMDAAEKFDDLVFQYENERKDGKVYRFLQAKHKQDESKKIAVNDLLTEKDEDFSLQKY